MASSSSTWPRLLTQRSRAFVRGLPHRVLWALFGGCFLTGLSIALVFPSPLPPAAALVQEGVVLLGFIALWTAAQSFFEQRPVSPLRTLGTPIVVGLGLVLIIGLVRLTDLYAPTMPTAAGIVQRQLLALLQIGFFFFLLLQLQRLVLYRRTRQSQRNWHLMLFLMTLTALTAFGRAPGEGLGTLQAIFLVPAVVLMVLNSFRLSWIIGLSLSDKVAGAVLSLGLLITVSVVTGTESTVAPAVDGNALEVYSYVLDVFALQAAIFGILYSLTALLSLVFHLPTTGDMQRKSDETATLHALTHLVDQTFDAEKLGASIAAAPVEAGFADAAWLALDDASERLTQGEATEGPQVVAASRLTPRKAEQHVDLQALFEEVRRTQAPLVLENTHSDPRVHAQSHNGLASLLVVPLVTRGVFVGALFAARNVTRGFEEDDISSIQAFASQAALALDHARLFEEQIEKERLERELDIARDVQQRLLPRRLPDVEGLGLAASSTPAREVGGDYYDFASLDDGRLAFIVADVSGKGTQAAFYMAEMQGLFRSLSRLKPAPTDFLSHTNEALRDILEEGTFVSALYGLFDPADQTLTLARAGHCPVAFLRKGQTPHLLRPNGMALGMASTPLFEGTLVTEHLSLQPGDILALYTDGLVESRSADGEEYGYDRVLDSLENHGQDDPAALRDGLLEDLCTFTAREAYDDDLTLVVLQWRGVSDTTADAGPAASSSSSAVSSNAVPSAKA